MKNHLFCIAHKDLLFEPPEGTKIICTGKYRLDSSYNIIHSKKDLYSKYKFLAGVAGSFYINELLEYVDDNDIITIFFYRKFISKKLFGDISWQILVNRESLKQIDLYSEFNSISEKYCFSHPTFIGTMIGQYNICHHIQDFLRFFACAVDLNVIPKDEFINFINQSIIIPGGIEIGKFPVGVYKEIVSKIELVVNLFLTQHNTVTNLNDEVQSRAIAFCCERLSSWLLIKHLEEKFNKNFIKSGNYIEYNANLLVEKHTLNFEEYFGYLHLCE